MGVRKMLAVTAALCAAALGLSACATVVPSKPTAPLSTDPVAPYVTPATATPTPTSTAQPPSPAPATKPAVPRPSKKSLAYAKSLGGTSHQGKTLYFVVGNSVGSEAEAQEELKGAIPHFGDMQSYFIVQRSDNFKGMRPGWWVVIEAYNKPPSAENRSFAKRGFPDAYVKKATVLTSDPIPVYNEVVPGAE
jgi:hypothetical protein